MIYEQKHPIIERILNNIDKVIIGKRDIAELSLVALLAEGHVLLEDVPGVGKTMMVRSLAKSMNASFKRIQFTPDLLPSDVTGTSIYNPREQEFFFRPGPIMGNIILADEINRTSPKTQSALLEGMEEASVTVDGVTRKLEKPFFVMATQNPIEYEGTYPLPEAQLDRFLLKMKMGYPEAAEEMELLSRSQTTHPIENLEPVVSLEDVRQMQQDVRKIYVDDTMKRYIVELADRTRKDSHVYLGASPRGSIALMKAAQAYAFMNGREYVLPDDIQYLAPFVFSHRIILKSEAKYDGISAEDLVQTLLTKIPVPVQRLVK
ncbi:AAA family ATPase [Peribacillus tepidiphilus]|uniref:AAA family ATPase n=1 Tax=Peribacillus tepidiphilus TaxID=2652445 RepID=UPI0035B54AD1